ncbi:MAG TPA: hypothetical protein VKX49_07625 [Bryobacteraceae bacterium]|nr:hypothetical protein [Bryobacteraceae bacterium]
MSGNQFSSLYSSARRLRLHSIAIVLLFAGLIAALAGDVYEFVRGEHRSRDVELMQHNLQTQITRLSDATSGAFDVTQQRFQNVKNIQDSLASELIKYRSEWRRDNGEVTRQLQTKNQELEAKNRELLAQLAALKAETTANLQTASAKLRNTSAKLETTSASVERIASEAEKNRADLRRIAGDLGAVTASVSRNSREFAALRQPDSRQRFDFHLLKTKVPTRIAGTIQIAVRSTDPKRNRYSMDLYADDKIAAEKNRAANEPVQLYLRGAALPYEVVVTEVRKDEVVGYVSAPVSGGSRIESTSATLHGVSINPATAARP